MPTVARSWTKTNTELALFICRMYNLNWKDQKKKRTKNAESGWDSERSCGLYSLRRELQVRELCKTKLTGKAVYLLVSLPEVTHKWCQRSLMAVANISFKKSLWERLAATGSEDLRLDYTYHTLYDYICWLSTVPDWNRSGPAWSSCLPNHIHHWLDGRNVSFPSLGQWSVNSQWITAYNTTIQELRARL